MDDAVDDGVGVNAGTHPWRESFCCYCGQLAIEVDSEPRSMSSGSMRKKLQLGRSSNHSSKTSNVYDAYSSRT
ncbi:hypothetical protein GCM10025779_18010 [Arthrobacter cryoconiti]